MDVKDVLKMNGEDQDVSYSRHSRYQQRVVAATLNLVASAMELLFSSESSQMQFSKLFNAADLGCATGPSTYSIISTVKGMLRKKCLELGVELPEIQFYLNDLPGNDFNSLFRNLPKQDIDDNDDGMRCYVMGTPGSFHGRLFPRSCLHLIYSGYSAHWLSKVPTRLTNNEGTSVNKGKVYISTTSPPIVKELYLKQFQEDLTLFLRSRSSEMVSGACMVLTLFGRTGPDPTDQDCIFIWEILAQSISHLISQGLVDQKKLDSFDLPFYIASIKEVEDIVHKEGSFSIHLLEALVMDMNDDPGEDLCTRASKQTKNFRAFTEPLMLQQFGLEVMDQLYAGIYDILYERLAKGNIPLTTIISILRKNIQY